MGWSNSRGIVDRVLTTYLGCIIDRAEAGAFMLNPFLQALPRQPNTPKLTNIA